MPDGGRHNLIVGLYLDIHGGGSRTTPLLSRIPEFIGVPCLVTKSCPVFCDPTDCLTHQAPLPLDFPRENTGVGCRFLSPGDLPDPGIKPTSPALAGGFLTAEPPGKPAQVSLMV